MSAGGLNEMTALLDYLFLLVAWTNLTEPLKDGLVNIVGDPLLAGLVILLFIIMFGLFLSIPFSALLVIFVPLSFILISIPELRIIGGITVGILIGMALIKWVRR